MTMEDRPADPRGWREGSLTSQGCAALQNASGAGAGELTGASSRQARPPARMRAATGTINGFHMDDDGPFAAAPGDRDILFELTNLPTPSESLLRRLFDLTPAEARLAQAIARGDSLEQIAQALNVKMTTARSQLAAVFGKTRTSRQAQLVAILSRLAHLK